MNSGKGPKLSEDLTKTEPMEEVEPGQDKLTYKESSMMSRLSRKLMRIENDLILNYLTHFFYRSFPLLIKILKFKITEAYILRREFRITIIEFFKLSLTQLLIILYLTA